MHHGLIGPLKEYYIAFILFTAIQNMTEIIYRVNSKKNAKPLPRPKLTELFPMIAPLVDGENWEEIRRLEGELQTIPLSNRAIFQNKRSEIMAEIEKLRKKP